eukprot:5895060-Prorocentrum_lima.AAC.1
MHAPTGTREKPVQLNLIALTPIGHIRGVERKLIQSIPFIDGLFGKEPLYNVQNFVLKRRRP